MRNFGVKLLLVIEINSYYKKSKVPLRNGKIMGQSCSMVMGEIVNRKHEIMMEDFPRQQGVENSGEVGCLQDVRKTSHKIPKASQLNVKTLSQKNEKSDVSLRQQRPRRNAQLINLQYYKQFATLKQLIDSKSSHHTTLHSNILSQSSLQKQNISHILQQDLSPTACENISLNNFCVQQQKQRVFEPVSINIADFIKISERPITDYYEFKEKIGQGSFGNVYRAMCKLSGEQRAIKVLKKKQMSKQNKKQFMAEMQLLSSLDHPNIIKVYQLYYYNSFYYVVTEYCKGGTILNYLNQKQNYGQKFVSKIIRQLLSALQYLHQNLIVHLDIKLENVVFLEKFRNQNDKIYIKLIDFGCSKNFVPFKKKKGKIAGTLSYIAPQCLQGYYSEKCDIWSTGVLMHILLSGVSPFKGRDTKQTMRNIQNKEISLQGKVWGEISTNAKDLLKLMLDRNATRRISAKSCLQHKWFQSMRHARSTVIGCQVLRNLQRFYRGNNFVTIISTFLSLRKINQQQRKRLTDIFTLLDSDNSGTIQVAQLFDVYQKQFGHHDIQQVKQIINKIDVNRSSSINFNQFLLAMTDRKKMFQRVHLKQAFQYFDTDRTGYIEKNQLKEILKGCEKEEFEYILNELDKDGDQKVSEEEFVAYLAKY